MRRLALALVTLLVAVTVLVTGTSASAVSLPSEPLDVSVTTTAGTATISWRLPATDGGTSVRGYLVTRDGTDTNGYGAWSKLVPSDIRQYTLLHLRPGATYHLAVAAVTAAGAGPAVSRTVIVSGTSPLPPVLTITTSANAAKLTWTEPTNANGTILGYNVTRDGLDLYGNGPEDVGAGGPALFSYTFDDLRPSTRYTFTVVALTAAGRGQIATANATTLSSGVAPVAAVSMTAERAVLTWEAPVNPGGVLTGYRVRHLGSDDRGYSNFVATVGPEIRSFTFNRLQRDTRYDFVVTPVLTAGFGPNGFAEGTTTPAWTSAGASSLDTRSQPRETALSVTTVPRLRQQWGVTTAGYLSSTPAVVDGIVYMADDRGFDAPTLQPGGSVTAYDAATGAVRWTRSVAAITGIPGDTGRGTPAVADGRVVFGTRPPAGSTSTSLIALDAKTGGLLWKRVVDTQRGARITGSPTVSGARAIVGISSSGDDAAAAPQFRGGVVAVNVTNGKLLWRTYTVPVGYTGGAVWGSPAVFPAYTNRVYVSTGNNYTVPAGVCTRPAQTGCAAPAADDYADSLLALDAVTGARLWSLRTPDADVWRQTCRAAPADCGPDAELGSSPNLFFTVVSGVPRWLVGVGSRSGIYWAADAVSGRLLWRTAVGSGAPNGGIDFGTASDSERIYIANANGAHKPWTLPSGQVSTAGGWTALDAATGRIAWQVADPQSATDIGFVSTANGVVYAGSTAVNGANMYALDATTGRVLWSHASGGSVMGGAAIVDGHIYWGSGYYTQTCPPAPAVCAPTRRLLSFRAG